MSDTNINDDLWEARKQYPGYVFGRPATKADRDDLAVILRELGHTWAAIGTALNVHHTTALRGYYTQRSPQRWATIDNCVAKIANSGSTPTGSGPNSNKPAKPNENSKPD